MQYHGSLNYGIQKVSICTIICANTRNLSFPRPASQGARGLCGMTVNPQEKGERGRRSGVPFLLERSARLSCCASMSTLLDPSGHQFLNKPGESSRLDEALSK